MAEITNATSQYRSIHASKWISLLLALSLAVSGCSSLPSWMGGKKKEVAKLPGERIAVLPVSTALKPDETLKDIAVVLPPVNANADWPQHSGVVTPGGGNLAGGAFDKVMQASIGDSEAYASTLLPEPVVAGGAVFAMDGAGYITAYDAADISHVRWTSKGVKEHDGPAVIGGGLAVDNGRLYAVSGRGVVACFDAATGKELWRKSLDMPLRSAPMVSGGKLFVVSLDNQLYALNAATGEVMWNHRGIDEMADIMKSVSPAVAGETVIAPYSSGEIYALSVADGKEIWSDSLSPRQNTQAGAFTGIGGDPVIDGQVVIAVSSGGMIGVYALADGQHLWARPIGSINTPWLAGDYMYLLTTDNTLVCMVKFNGRLKWAMKLRDFADAKDKQNPITWRGPVVADGKVIVSGSDGHVLLVDAADGKVVARRDVAQGIYTAPVIAGGRLYLIGQDATLYELQ